MYQVGQNVAVNDPSGPIAATVAGVNADGSLALHLFNVDGSRTFEPAMPAAAVSPVKA